MAEEKDLNQEEKEEMEQQPSTEEAPVQAENATAEEEQPAADASLEKINELEQKLEEAENRYLRLLADFDNLRRRTQLDREASEKYRAQSLISDLLPLLDNFERALKVEASNEQTKSVLQGMEMVYKGLVAALEKEGVEVIEAVGKEFDPNFHQAVMTDSDDQYGPNEVIEEFQKGYKLKDRIIRPSMVKVNQ
ncbi:nucleotide exchange factor GrpE [Pseudobacillus wudalianchiensis]|uniref:Protein GrpE n=1 Tax=Pseudobacillus wudalianchiensis TaxID=1743143 RepID=A0A1B9B8V9_9BACI|nr:nucleotide exchange factor GrpE [Bacillus wudalianchiensis]OCA92502.1 nucleotide exchange factor GrpE [Bacillus wudalianchiensis]